MNTRFNFLVQIALVAMVFSFSAVNGFGQFGGGVTLTRTGSNGGDCVDGPGGVVIASLFLDASSIEEAQSLLSNSNCDLFVGLSPKGGGNTSYSSLESLSSSSFEVTTIALDIDGSNNDLAQPDILSESSNIRFNKVRAIELHVSLTIPHFFIGQEEWCQHAVDGTWSVGFELNLFCFNGTTYEPVNSCDFDNLFFNQLDSDDCSLEQCITIDFCCYEEQGRNFEEKNTGLLEFVQPSSSITCSGFGFRIRSSGDKQFTFRYEVVTLDGKLIKKGKEVLMDNTHFDISLEDSIAGLYILVVIDEYGRKTVKKIMKV